MDEDKERRLIGVLAVPNSVALEQILQSIRSQYGLRLEVKWNQLDRYRMPVAVSWIRVAAWFRGVKFACMPWPKGLGKGDIALGFFKPFLESHGRRNGDGAFDTVAFVDFDTEDKNSRLHDYLKRRARILRCYPIDSRATNCLQLADLLTGCWDRCGGSPTPVPDELRKRWPDLPDKLRVREKVTAPDFRGSECKAILSAFASGPLLEIRA